MDKAEKARFILALHKHSLKAFDEGGTVLAGPSNVGALNASNPSANGIAGGVGSVLGLNNNFQAAGANLQAGTNSAQLNNAYSGVQNALQGQEQFANQAAGQNGFGNQSSTFAQQQALAQQLQQQANGQGPNPAQAALNQATGQNIAQQGAMMASQRGAGANVGLLARQAAQQGAATQQQAAGQSAVLQAQQQIAAQSALAQQQAQMQGVAQNQISNQYSGASGLSSAQQGEQGILQNANSAFNKNAVDMQSNINNVNAATAAANQKSNSALIGGLIQGASAAFMHAKGGEVVGPKSFVAQWLKESGNKGIEDAEIVSDNPTLAADGGNVAAENAKQKAVKKGDSYSNDKVPSLLSEGEIVIPRHITMGKDAPKRAAEFVAQSLAKRRVGKKK